MKLTIQIRLPSAIDHVKRDVDAGRARLPGDQHDASAAARVNANELEAPHGFEVSFAGSELTAVLRAL